MFQKRVWYFVFLTIFVVFSRSTSAAIPRCPIYASLFASDTNGFDRRYYAPRELGLSWLEYRRAQFYEAMGVPVQKIIAPPRVEADQRIFLAKRPRLGREWLELKEYFSRLDPAQSKFIEMQYDGLKGRLLMLHMDGRFSKWMKSEGFDAVSEFGDWSSIIDIYDYSTGSRALAFDGTEWFVRNPLNFHGN